MGDLHQAPCQRAVRIQMKRQSNDIRAKPGMMLACKKDISVYCSNVSPGHGQMHLCLREHKAQNHLKNQLCIKMVQEVVDWEKEDVSLNAEVTLRCKSERKTFCRDYESGDSRLL